MTQPIEEQSIEELEARLMEGFQAIEELLDFMDIRQQNPEFFEELTKQEPEPNGV